MDIDVTLLRDVEHGGAPDQPERVVSQLADFVNAAQSSLHIAVYDFRLQPNGRPYDLLVNGLKRRAQAGVEVKIAFNRSRPAGPGSGADPASGSAAEFLAFAFQGSSIQTKGIADIDPLRRDGKLMHSKYIVRDGDGPQAALWTGSVNLDDDAWTFQENNMVQVASAELARYYETDFQEIWESGGINSTGLNDVGTVMVGQTAVEVAFSPGEGPTIDARVADLIRSSKQRIRLASMLVSSRHVLEALLDVIRNRQVPDFKGIYDSTQMAETIENWKQVPRNVELIPMFEEMAGQLAAKASVPYSPQGKHNFMHDKVVVCDDCVFTGSFNLSHSATQNAESTLMIHDRALADRYSDYIDQLAAEYGRSK